MHTLSKKAFVAIEAVLFIALHNGVEPVCGKNIGRYQGVAARYLEHILQVLVHAGILRGQRGPKGGYFLARERRKITLGEIYEALMKIDGEPNIDHPLSALNTKVIEPMWEEIQKHLVAELSKITVQELCDRAVKQGLETETKKPDFTI